MAAAQPKRKVLIISTDPAHNLSDAFAQQLHGKPQQIVGVPNLYAMESDPADALEKATEEIAHEEESDKASEIATEFRQWIQSVPGIDEAMALSNVLKYLESGQFGLIVFDTAPTGHTLRLLQLPAVLKVGLEKLNSWKAKLAGVLGSLVSVVYEDSSAQKQAESMKKLETKLQEYQASVTKISEIFRDQEKTQFVCVCIAEHLSVYETRRLCAELLVAKINCRHILVNQLVPFAIAGIEMGPVSTLLSTAAAPPALCSAITDAVELCGARAKIQSIYLSRLQASVKETGGQSTTLLPLLPREVRGVEALKAFSEYLVKTDHRLEGRGEADLSVLAAEASSYEAEVKAKFMKDPPQDDEEDDVEMLVAEEEKLPGGFHLGDMVKLKGLQSAKQHNGKKGRILSFEKEKQRFQLQIIGTKNTLLLKPENLELIEEQESNGEASTEAPKPAITPAMMQVVQGMLMQPGGLQKLLSHPLVAKLKKTDTKMKQVFINLEQNGLMAGLQYLGDTYVMGKLADIAQQLQGKA
eukprot:gb/GEZN01004718.1/.p1 GENE.gb/GEZN01004718.1/~~gb/GEZN01004718.1/.p1  ORF type:complete len:618 (+),score=97.03 gb/GEZN01004718.1/:279-1856(+)